MKRYFIIMAYIVSQSITMFSMDKIAALIKRDKEIKKEDKKFSAADAKNPGRPMRAPLRELRRESLLGDKSIIKGSVSFVLHCGDECSEVDRSTLMITTPVEQCKSHRLLGPLPWNINDKVVVTFLDAQGAILAFYPKDPNAIQMEDILDWGMAKLDKEVKQPSQASILHVEG
jgi:hypothetical protein